MSNSTGPAATWPADVIHVNEDGWVLINRGTQQGVPAGMRLLVVGSSVREVRDLFPPGSEQGMEREEEDEAEPESDHVAHEAHATGEAGESTEPVVLRTRRTYELLEVVHVEPSCAVAIAARTPADRRPQFYRGPHGELLVWVPLPSTFTYPKPNAGDEEEEEEAEQPHDLEEGEAVVGAASIDVPPQRVEQEDERWEEALPLNGVGVGDQVVPAMPVGPAQPTMGTGAQSASSSGQPQVGSPPLTPFEQGQSYDWMKPQ